MVAALGEELLAAVGGEEVIVDGTNGVAVCNPGAEALALHPRGRSGGGSQARTASPPARARSRP